LAGLGIFLFGMLLIEESVRALSGRAFRRIIRQYTDGRLRSIAIVLTALNSQLITFDMAMAMVIGANVGTTITVLLGAIGGVQAKKRVALSHLFFNVITGLIAFFSIPILVEIINFFLDVKSNSLTGLALFHTLFNVLGVIIFFPFVGLLSRMLVKFYPEFKPILTVYIDKTPTEVPDAATAALRKEIFHLLQECQLYNLRLLKIDPKLLLDNDTPFEKNLKRKFTIDDLYGNIKLLHAEIFTYYSQIQNQKLNEPEAKELERLIYASRNIMNALKNFKGIRHNMDEFDSSDNLYLNAQYKLFRKRLLELYHHISHILNLDNKEEQYRSLLNAFGQIERADNLFIGNISKAVRDQNIPEIEIASLLLVNRLFTQSCRMQIYSMKDLILSQEQINDFDSAMEKKEAMGSEKAISPVISK
jgi:phosphate:Na+ symporter